MMRTRAVTTDEDQRVTFIELFIDLIFVYAVTQLVALLHHELSWAGAARAVLVFWPVWWAWTQFTWALNSADTTHPGVELSVLVATAVVFLMAVVLPDAFTGGGAWFAITYVSVRVIGLAVYGRVAWDDPAKRAAVRRFALLSVGGLLAITSVKATACSSSSHSASFSSWLLRDFLVPNALLTQWPLVSSPWPARAGCDGPTSAGPSRPSTVRWPNMRILPAQSWRATSTASCISQ